MSQAHTVFKYAHDFGINGNLNFKGSLSFLFPRGGKKNPCRHCIICWVFVVLGVSDVGLELFSGILSPFLIGRRLITW
jgi:hypothetical protein